MALTVTGKAKFSYEGTLVYLDVEIQPDHPVEHDRLARIAALKDGRLQFSTVFHVPEDPTSVVPQPESTSDTPSASDLPFVDDVRKFIDRNLLKDLRDLDVTPDE